MAYGKSFRAALRLFVFIGCGFAPAQMLKAARPDSTKWSVLSNLPVHYYCSDLKQGFWVVAGKDTTDILHLQHSGKVENLSDKLQLPRGMQITCIYPLGDRRLLVGTKCHYVYDLKYTRATLLDYQKGLADSCITSITWDSHQNRVQVMAKATAYVLIDDRKHHTVRFRKLADEDSAVIGKTPGWILRNYVRKPVQQAICLTFSDVDYSFKPHKAIKTKQARTINKALRPGDILIKRNDYQLSNLAIDGFWTHSAIYLGSLNDLDVFFGHSTRLNGQSFSHWLKYNHFEAYTALKKNRGMMIEAIAQGITVNPLSHIVKVDHFAALRPQITKDELLEAMFRVFSFYGKPYDFLFDLQSNDALVCSELVYKTYAPFIDMGQLSRRNGQTFCYPSDFARQLCHEKELPNRRLELVLFCGPKDDQGNKAVFKDLYQFCKTLEY